MIRFPKHVRSQLDDLHPDSIEAGQIHLWKICLAEHPLPLEQLRGWLSAAERDRASRFVLESQVDRYTTCRAAVRQILGQYLGRRPEKIQIEIRPDGKPVLADDANRLGLQFNLSHSGDLALLGIAWGVEVGVDVERLRAISGFDRMVQRCLERTEREQVLRSPPADRVRHFLRFWTHKEAYLKMFGVGLRRSLQDVVMDLQAPPYWRTVSHRQLFPTERAVSLVELAPEDGFVGAIAWASSGACEPAYFSWSDLTYQQRQPSRQAASEKRRERRECFR